jgi:hypothetical protein
MVNDYGHWNIDLVGEFDPAEWFGFIYLIRDTETTRCYLGKKQFRFKRSRQVSGRKRKISVDSDWKDYTSSCIPLQDDIIAFGKSRFQFIILQLCSGKAELSYLEEQYQYGSRVITARLADGTPKFYNRTIAHRHFSGVEKQSAESAQKITASLMTYHNTPERQAQTNAIRTEVSDILRIIF